MSSPGSPRDIYSKTVAVFDQRDDPTEPLTTPEVADSLDVARRTVYKRLEKLVARGELRTKKVGANARVWWRPAEGPTPTLQTDQNAPRPSKREAPVEAVLERITDGFYGLDNQFRFTYLNAQAETLLGLEEPAALGRDIHDELTLTEEFRAALHEAYKSQKPVHMEDYYDPLGGWFENRIYPSETGLSVHFHDISARKRLEHYLEAQEEHFRTAVQNSPLVAFRLDTDLRYTWIANPHEDFDSSTVLGKRDDELLPPDAADVIMEPKRKALETGERVREEVTYELPSGVVSYDLTVAPLRDETGDIVGLTAASLDLTERKRRERALEEYRQKYRTLIDNFPSGAVALVDQDLRYVVFGGTPGDPDMSSEDYEGKPVREVLPPHHAAVVVPRYEAALEGEASAFEATIDDTVYQLTFLPVRDDDGEVFAATALAQDITRRVEREKELAALNRLNQVVQDVTHLLLETSTREQVEQTVSTILTESDAYEHAQLGRLDCRGQTLEFRPADGDVKRSPVTIPLIGEPPTSAQPFVDATQARDVQVAHSLPVDPLSERWAREATVPEARAVIPITYDDRVYGVLAVYASREHAFDATERRILEQLGRVVGHAITAIERRQALLEDQVTELTFRSEAVGQAFADALSEPSLTILIERSISLADGQTISYYSIEGGDPEAFIDVIEELSDEVESRVIEQSGTRYRVEIRTVGETLATRLAKYNGSIVESRVDDGEFRIVIQVPRGSDIREIADTVSVAYPDAELIAQAQSVRETHPLPDAISEVDERLTERQRTTLQMAFYAGYFDWPRAITGEGLAELLNVTPATVSHHLRHAERKLLAAFFAANE